MKRVLSVAPARHLLALVGLAFAASVGSLSAADHYYVNDHLATTTAVTDAAGEIAAIEADAFGTPVAGATQAARFTGKPYDDDIGAFVFPFRNYRSDEARWMSADPSGFPDGVNNQTASAHPLTLIDPWGLALTPISLDFTGSTNYTAQVNGNLSSASRNVAYNNTLKYEFNSKGDDFATDPYLTNSPLWSGNGSNSNGPFIDTFVNYHVDSQGDRFAQPMQVSWLVTVLPIEISTKSGTEGGKSYTQIYFEQSISFQKTVISDYGTPNANPITTNEGSKSTGKVYGTKIFSKE